MVEAKQSISRNPDIPSHIQEVFTQELQKISQEFDDEQRRVQEEFNRLNGERDNLLRQLQASKADNNRLLQERKTLELRHQKSSERMQAIESRWKSIQEDLIEKIEIQKGQISGKRALWMEANPGSSARRDAMTNAIGDPFNSPTANQTPSYSGSVMGSMISPAVTSPPQSSFGTSRLDPPPRFPRGSNPDAFTTGGYSAGGYGKSMMGTGYNVGRPSQNRPSRPTVRRMGNLPTGTPLTSAFMPSNDLIPLNSFSRFSTEPRSDQGGMPCSVPIIHKDNGKQKVHSMQTGHETQKAREAHKAQEMQNAHERLAAEYKAAISKLYDLVEAWVLNYADKPCSENDRAIARGNSVLWDYMMNCTYPGLRQDAHTHVVALLSDSNTRSWFIMRLATEYCILKMMSIKTFKSYNMRVGYIITEMLDKLKERGMIHKSSLYLCPRLTFFRTEQ